MKFGFFLARHLPMPQLRRIAWQERLTKKVYKNLIARAQENTDPSDPHNGHIVELLNEQYTDLRMLNGYLASSLMKPGMSRGFGIRRFMAPTRMPHMAQQVSAKM